MLQTKIIFIYKFVWIIIFSFSPQNSCFNQMYRLSNMINMKHPAIHLNPTLSVLKIATVEQGAHHQKQQNGRATSTLKTSYSLASYFLLAILSAIFSLCGRALWYTWSKKHFSFSRSQQNMSRSLRSKKRITTSSEKTSAIIHSSNIISIWHHHPHHHHVTANSRGGVHSTLGLFDHDFRKVFSNLRIHCASNCLGVRTFLGRAASKSLMIYFAI